MTYDMAVAMSSRMLRMMDCPDCWPGLQSALIAAWLSEYIMHSVYCGALSTIFSARCILWSRRNFFGDKLNFLPGLYTNLNIHKRNIKGLSTALNKSRR